MTLLFPNAKEDVSVLLPKTFNPGVRCAPYLPIAWFEPSDPQLGFLICGFYEFFLGRDPEPAGMLYWWNYVHAYFQHPSTAPWDRIKSTFAQGVESESRIHALYQVVLGRDGSDGEVKGWTAFLNQQAGPEFANFDYNVANVLFPVAVPVRTVQNGLVGSEEASSNIRALYRYYLGREASPAEVEEWRRQLDTIGLFGVESFEGLQENWCRRRDLSSHGLAPSRF